MSGQQKPCASHICTTPLWIVRFARCLQFHVSRIEINRRPRVAVHRRFFGDEVIFVGLCARAP